MSNLEGRQPRGEEGPSAVGVTVPEWLLDAGASPTAVVMYCRLASYGTWDASTASYVGCAPSRSALALKADISPATAARMLRELIGLGALVRSRTTRADGGYAPTVYQVMCGAPDTVKAVAIPSPVITLERHRPRGPAVLSKSKRLRIFARDGWACVGCGATEDLTIDHIYPRARGGGNDDENLGVLCLDCNSRKGAGIPNSVTA